jgi:nicotinamidase-related amidase
MWSIWNDLLTEQDRAVIVQAGYDTQGASLWDSRRLGRYPALLVVDMQEMLIGRNTPILQAITDYRTAMGAIAWQAMRHIAPFVETIRRTAIPIFYTRVIPQDRSADDPAVQIVAQLTPHSEDVVIDKPYTSAFFNTDLMAHLVRRQVDTLIVVGNSTSGCIRAAVVDARQLGLHPLVPVECVFDRIEASHKIGLLDMWMKYASVMSVAETLGYVSSLEGLAHGD